jgi:hypothetical protein
VHLLRKKIIAIYLLTCLNYISSQTYYHLARHVFGESKWCYFHALVFPSSISRLRKGIFFDFRKWMDLTILYILFDFLISLCLLEKLCLGLFPNVITGKTDLRFFYNHKEGFWSKQDPGFRAFSVIWQVSKRHSFCAHQSQDVHNQHDLMLIFKSSMKQK